MKSERLIGPLALCAGLSAALAPHSVALAAPATFFFNDSAYRSAADIPAGFYASGAPAVLENFEDGLLDASLTANRGSAIGSGGNTDSVDGDDGLIDGSGNGGRSWFGASPITFTFAGPGPLPTAFALVWTDGSGTVTFSAIAADGTSLGDFQQTLGDGSIRGTTAEDRFLGVQFAGGIRSITLSAGGSLVELDHVQFGSMPTPPTPPSGVPEPTSLALAVGSLALLSGRRRVARPAP